MVTSVTYHYYITCGIKHFPSLYTWAIHNQSNIYLISNKIKSVEPDQSRVCSGSAQFIITKKNNRHISVQK